ncbi:hypothetical protein A2477_03245 [Candidatus Falkowbacteria bacterium RIFOXYC2_FULL_47_12]|uniref:Uncharacterized protein n=2 Tax=Candidatus Falkowiibacteriota TaxID=1752728 RepID=A0A1F5TPU3_9BACT|nr:MAG: hypothetical protein A2242_04880 [Candidatus Falkowbacteria bacterium RIFOXYA2_FULL_47_9]OGF40985.1 MAG: hypothetical protein A2477_03245 [Candidatus Falkowbacteria bacterium RIFOXYC2_FULL_47_12]
MVLNDADIKTLKEYVYTPYGDIKAELDARWNNRQLREKVEIFLGEYFLKELFSQPRAVLARTIFTPNREFYYFADIVSDFSLQPLLFEYGGKFVAKNTEKYHLCRMFFLDYIGEKGIRFSSKNIVDFNHNEGKDMRDIQTHWGEGLVDFHHRLFACKHPKMVNDIVNFSKWFDSTRFLNKSYYFYFFSLFICHGVLFENFLIEDKEEAAFIKEHVLGSFKEVHKFFGVKPLIMPLLPLDNEKFRTWMSYSPDMKTLLGVADN